MATFDYVEIPPNVIRLKSSPHDTEIHSIRRASQIYTSLPRTEGKISPPSSFTNITSPSKAALNMLPQLLSSSLPLPSPMMASSFTTSQPRGQPHLLSTRDPLSIPITTVNFKRFISRAGPIFWLQDRLEEIVMWRKGWKFTSVWMAAYAFFCYFPRMVLLLPHAVIIGIMLATYPKRTSSEILPTSKIRSVPPPPPAHAGEGSVDWQANIQAIQNLMGAVSDLHDQIVPVVPHLTHATPYSPLILTIVITSFTFLVPILVVLPMRPVFLVLGLTPFFLTHPYTQQHLFPLVSPILTGNKILRMRIQRLIDDDRLDDLHWRSELREVELFENERWSGSGSSGSGPESDGTSASTGSGEAGSWSKTHLRPGERSAWTRGRDGWSGVGEDGSGEISSNLTFSLAAGWAFVETEDWRADTLASWINEVGSDDSGWIYTNDSWLDPHPTPLDTWKNTGMTRRRRWIRRIYYDPVLTT